MRRMAAKLHEVRRKMSKFDGINMVANLCAEWVCQKCGPKSKKITIKRIREALRLKSHWKDNGQYNVINLKDDWRRHTGIIIFSLNAKVR